MDIYRDIALGVEQGNANLVQTLTEKALAQKLAPIDVLHKGLMRGMSVVGEKFKAMEMFIPEVIFAAKAMTAGIVILKPHLGKARMKSNGKIVIGTVKGDLHDLGKNIVVIMLKGAGYDVSDLGTDVSKEKFLESAKKEKADLIGMSALLTTTMPVMKEVVDELKKRNIRHTVKVVIGGAPVTEAYATKIGADGYAPDASSAVDLVRSLLANK